LDNYIATSIRYLDASPVVLFLLVLKKKHEQTHRLAATLVG
jgi:hypothetical protein